MEKCGNPNSLPNSNVLMLHSSFDKCAVVIKDDNIRGKRNCIKGEKKLLFLPFFYKSNFFKK